VSVRTRLKALKFSERRFQGGEVELGFQSKMIEGGDLLQGFKLDIGAHRGKEVVRLRGLRLSGDCAKEAFCLSEW
jgi:hypothetical protein